MLVHVIASLYKTPTHTLHTVMEVNRVGKKVLKLGCIITWYMRITLMTDVLFFFLPLSYSFLNAALQCLFIF